MGKLETLADFFFPFFLFSKIFGDGDCSREVKRCLLLGMKAMTNIENILKSRYTTFATKFHVVKADFFK